MSKNSQSTREQRLLGGIDDALNTLKAGAATLPPSRALRAVSVEKLVPRAERLPLMIQRHGPAQTLMFLESKDTDEDNALLFVFTTAMGLAEPTLAARLPKPGSRALGQAVGGNGLTQRLHLTLCCVELANLLMRRLKVLDIHREEEAKRQATGGAQ